jgi:hypothetical protein
LLKIYDENRDIQTIDSRRKILLLNILSKPLLNVKEIPIRNIREGIRIAPNPNPLYIK